MTYTFDDAIKHWNRESANGPLVPGIVASPLRNVPQQEYDRVKFMNRLFYSIIEQLREEYAPTVEMTKAQYETLMYYKRNEDNYANPLAQLLLSLYEDVGGGDDWGLYDGWDVDEESELVLYVEAWLHPETIKVIDE